MSVPKKVLKCLLLRTVCKATRLLLKLFITCRKFLCQCEGTGSGSLPLLSFNSSASY